MRCLFDFDMTLFASSRERGTVFVELALTLPVVLAVIFATIEFSRSLRLIEDAATFSREAANSAFRQCGPIAYSAAFPDVDDTSTADFSALQTCMDRVRTSSELATRVLIPNARIIVSVFSVVPATSSISRISSPASEEVLATRDATFYTRVDIPTVARSCTAPSGTVINLTQQLSTNGVNDPALTCALATTGILVTAEIYAPHPSPIVGSFLNLFSYSPPGNYYDISVF